MDIIVNLITENNKVYATSRDIAEKLGKRHDDVCNKIKEVLTIREFSEREFRTSQGNVYKEYLLDKDAFILLLMNYTGFNDFKRAYIKRFNKMEETLKNSFFPQAITGDYLIEIGKKMLQLEEEKKNLINKVKDNKETIEIIGQDKNNYKRKKEIRSEVVKLVGKVSRQMNYSFKKIYETIYSNFIYIHPNISWKNEFFKSENKLEFLMDKDINYMKELRDITATYFK